MDTSADPTHRLTLGSFPAVVFVAMFAATLAGQLAGMALDVLVAGRRVWWVPVACSVVFEGLAGARVAAARLERALTTAECARLSTIYSVALAAISLPLWGWTLAAQSQSGGASPGSPAHGAAAMLGIGLAAFVVAGVLRFALMAGLSRARR